MGPLEALERAGPELLPLGATLLVACSGGRDSMCLFHALRRVGRWPLVVGTVDHGLRPGSRTDAEFVAARAAEWGTPCRILHLPPFDDEAAQGPEDAARRARHAALEALRVEVGAVRTVVAHTADDQLETVLMRLAAGAGARGLGGMAACAGAKVRPWLEVSRAEVAAYAEAHRVPYVEDPSNAEERFLRNRVRRWVTGPFEQVFGSAGRAGVLRTAAHLRAESAALDRLVRELLEPMRTLVVEAGVATSTLDLRGWRALADEVRPITVHRLVLELYDAAGREPPRRLADRVARVHGALEQGQGVSVGGRDGFTLAQRRDVAWLKLGRRAGHCGDRRGV